MSGWCELNDNGEFIAIPEPTTSRRRRRHSRYPEPEDEPEPESEPEQPTTMLIHGQIVQVKICKPGRAQGAAVDRWSSRYKQYKPQVALRPRATRIEGVTHNRVAIDPEDSRSNIWRKKHRYSRI